MTRTSPKINLFLFLAFGLLFGLAFLRVYVRVQTTLIGYQIGQLKNIEAELLQKRSELQMSYAKITTRDYLIFQTQKLSNSGNNNKVAAQ